MSWAIQGVIIFFIFYESVIFSIYKLLQQSNPEINLWVIMGSKVIKMIMTGTIILLVNRFSEIPLKQFALTTVGIYFVSVIVETIFFLKKKQNENNKK